jgi:nucleoside-diphosphate-sugar epimerase
MNDTSSTWQGRRVLVTGCTGFLGAAVVRELLGRGAEVVGLVRDRAAAAEFTRHRLTGKVHVVNGRAEDLFRVHSALAVHEARAVFDLVPADAARATATVLDATRRYDSRVPVVLARPHGTTFAPPAGQPVGVARFGALFGPGDRDTGRVVPATAAALLRGEQGFTIEGPARDFVDVRDAARACVMLAEMLLAEPGARVVEHAFRSGWERTDREMAVAVRDVFAGRGVLGTSLPADALGWAPAAGLADALAEAVAWCRDDLRVRSFGKRPVQRVAA